MTIAIIGAGAAGLSAAFMLKRAQPDTPITIYEKSRGLSGRAATRWHDLPDGGRVYVDHGAQYLKNDSPAMAALFAALPADSLTDIGRPVWTFDGANRIAEGDPAQNRAPKWSLPHGLATFGGLVAQAGALDIRLNVRIGKLSYTNGRYTLYDTDGGQVTEADRVLIAIPSGQAADLLAASDLPVGERAALENALREAVYRRCLAVTLGYARTLNARPYYALINSDKDHPLAWLAFEHDKPGHVPAGQSVIVAHFGGAYSAHSWDAEGPDIAQTAANMLSTLLNEDLRAPDWTEYQRWRYSQPDTLVAADRLNGVLDHLYFAGDYTLGGRVHLAAQSGADAAALMGK